MRARGITAAAGDTIPYIICRSSASSAAGAASTGLADCAYHPDELKRSSELLIDTDWYLQTQIHPPIARLCEHLDGTDAAQLAQCLGLDAKKYQSGGNQFGRREDSLLSQVKFVTRMPDEERFAQVQKLQVSCPACSNLQEFQGIIKGKPANCFEKLIVPLPENADSNARSSGLNCTECQAKLSVARLHNACLLNIHSTTKAYEAGKMHCDELSCGLESHRMGVYERRCLAEGCRGPMKPVLRADYLYTQLLYLKSLFSAEKVISRLGNSLTPADTKLVQSVANETEPTLLMIEEKLKLCQYPVIDFKDLFNF